MDVDDIRKDADERWFAQDGLMKLEPGSMGDHKGFGKGPTVRNDNGILWKFDYFLLMFQMAAIEEKDFLDFISSVRKLEVMPGLYNRRPGNNIQNEAHDNYVAISGFCTFYKAPFAAEIIEYGQKNGWSFFNLQPGMFSLRHVRQPGEIAFYYMCNRLRPYLLNYVWFLIGITINAFQKNNNSNTLLAWRRIKCVERSEIIETSKPHAFFFNIVYQLWYYMKKREMKHWNPIACVFNQFYQRSDHPVRRLAERAIGAKVQL